MNDEKELTPVTELEPVTETQSTPDAHAQRKAEQKARREQTRLAKKAAHLARMPVSRGELARFAADFQKIAEMIGLHEVMFAYLMDSKVIVDTDLNAWAAKKKIEADEEARRRMQQQIEDKGQEIATTDPGIAPRPELVN